MNPSPEKLAPIDSYSALARYHADPATRPGFVRGLFDETAPHYDFVNRVLSFGSGAWYRRRELKRTGLRAGMRVLDVAIGTGLVAREAVALSGGAPSVVGLDISMGMLAQVRRRLGVRLIQASAERIPVAGATFDFLSMGYALRHVSDLHVAFREFLRVLKPGGKLMILEIGRPRSKLGYQLAKGYFGGFIPWMSRVTTGSKPAGTLMAYYWDTIEHCVQPEAIVAAMRAVGFVDAGYREEFGLFRTYFGDTPVAR